MRQHVARILKFKRVTTFDDSRFGDAFDIGFNRGLADQHYESRTFRTGSEYVAWLAGWRAGQAELRIRKRAKDVTREKYEKEARERFDRLSAVSEDSGVPFDAVSGL